MPWKRDGHFKFTFEVRTTASRFRLYSVRL